MLKTTNSSSLDNLIENQNKLNYLLDAIGGNEEKYNALPSELKELLKPYKNKLKTNKKLDKEDYEKLKDILIIF